MKKQEYSLQNVLNSISADASKSFIDISSFTKILDNSIDKIADYVEKNMGNILNKSVNVGMTIVNTVISFILAIYMLCDKRRLQAGWKRFMRALLTEKSYRDGTTFWTRCNQILIRYFLLPFSAVSAKMMLYTNVSHITQT